MTDLREIQKTETEMLKALKTVCEENNIRYFLAQGTLLGAVRHKGFIPWDDDIDVFVPYREIPKLMKCFSEKYSEEYLITNHKVERYYPNTWTKIRKIKSASMPVRYKELPINWGICIDVFPVYEVSEIRLLQSIEIFLFKCGRRLLMCSMTKYDESKSVLRRLTEKIPLSVRRGLAGMLINVFNLHKEGKAGCVFVANKKGYIFEKEMFAHSVKLKFEGEEYSAPAEYDSFLTKIYGDYMTPPPAKEQGGHELKAGEIIWDCNRSYMEYK